MLIGAVAFGLVLGLLAGGNLGNLAYIHLRRWWVLVAAVAIRFGTEFLLDAHVGAIEALRLPLLASSFALLLVALWPNRNYPGISLAFVGVLSNAVVIVINGGYMPIWEPSLVAAGLTPADVSSSIHVILPPALNASFLLHLGPFADVIPIPIPIVRNVASVGDFFLTAGLGFFLFASVVRVPKELEDEEVEAARRRLLRLTGSSRLPGSARAGIGTETGLAPALDATAALERPLIMGGAGEGLSAPAAAVGSSVTAPFPVGRVREHPYVRLALNGSFSALWTGQLISSFGDRLNQVALFAVVLYSSHSALASGLVFFAALLPNLLLSPIAGTFVDRWDHKEVMVVSDILRAAVVLIMPVAAVTNILLVYPLVFLVTSISVFFRPARVAILPRIVPESDLLSANSALWIGETIADVVGYGMAGIFVAALGSAVPLAFWVDSATYIASAALLTTIVVRASVPVVKAAVRSGAVGAFIGELKDGWQFLRGEAVLFANTLQATVGQFGLGVAIALTPAYVRIAFGDDRFQWEAVFGFIEMGIGAGNLIGGFIIGLVGARFGKGRMVITGYIAWGLLLMVFALTNNLGIAIGVAFGQGVANMIFVIPSQTLFQERTPNALMGRVIGIRFALVFGSMTIATVVAAVLGEIVGPSMVLALFGALSVGAGVAGLRFPAVRDA
jgi:MFS transporter, DHA3 family, macrolide efflux protein